MSVLITNRILMVLAKSEVHERAYHQSHMFWSIEAEANQIRVAQPPHCRERRVPPIAALPINNQSGARRWILSELYAR